MTVLVFVLGLLLIARLQRCCPARVLPGRAWILIRRGLPWSIAACRSPLISGCRQTGQPIEVSFQRWSNANPEKQHRLQPFGGYLSEFRPYRTDHSLLAVLIFQGVMSGNLLAAVGASDDLGNGRAARYWSCVSVGRAAVLGALHLRPVTGPYRGYRPARVQPCGATPLENRVRSIF